VHLTTRGLSGRPFIFVKSPTRSRCELYNPQRNREQSREHIVVNCPQPGIPNRGACGEDPGSSLLCLSGNSTFESPKRVISFSEIALLRSPGPAFSLYAYPYIALLRLKLQIICSIKYIIHISESASRAIQDYTVYANLMLAVFLMSSIPSGASSGTLCKYALNMLINKLGIFICLLGSRGLRS
jgi:hypothetical protein